MEGHELVYLGDGLYASYDGYQIKLMANSATDPTDTVYLDPAVVSALLDYIREVTEEQMIEEESA